MNRLNKDKGSQHTWILPLCCLKCWWWWWWNVGNDVNEEKECWWWNGGFKEWCIIIISFRLNKGRKRWWSCVWFGIGWTIIINVLEGLKPYQKDSHHPHKQFASPVKKFRNSFLIYTDVMRKSNFTYEFFFWNGCSIIQKHPQRKTNNSQAQVWQLCTYYFKREYIRSKIVNATFSQVFSRIIPFHKFYTFKHIFLKKML